MLLNLRFWCNLRFVLQYDIEFLQAFEYLLCAFEYLLCIRNYSGRCWDTKMNKNQCRTHLICREDRLLN